MNEDERKLQEWTRKLEDLKQKVQADPGDSGLKFQLAKCCYIGSKWDEALELLKEISEVPRLEAGVNFYSGRIHMKQGRYGLAITDLDRVMSQVISQDIRVDTGRLLIDCLQQEGRHNEANELKRRLGF